MNCWEINQGNIKMSNGVLWQNLQKKVQNRKKEQIIEFYLENGKYNKALVAVNLAHDQYPFSTELLINKAQIYIKLYLL